MKKMLLPLCCCMLALQSFATTWNVTVNNFQFSPATLNVLVGDVIHFEWIAGSHTTTSVSIPAGATAWDSPMNSTTTTFDVSVTQPGVYNYKCTPHAAFGMTASFTASGALPISLSAFTISTKNKTPQLLWSTATEINADYFSVRRSLDGTHFKEAGIVKASGTSYTEKNYSFVDNSLPATATYVYYELATIDKDGKTSLSPIKLYKNSFATPKLIISLSPNPVSSMGHLMLQYNADVRGSMIATLIDMQGKTVLKTQLASEPGVNNGHIHLMGVAPGIYTLHFVLNGVSESYRIEKN